LRPRLTTGLPLSRRTRMRLQAHHTPLWGQVYHSNGLSLRLLRRCLRITNFLELRKAEVRRTHHRGTSGSVKVHSWVTTLGQQGTEVQNRRSSTLGCISVVSLSGPPRSSACPHRKSSPFPARSPRCRCRKLWPYPGRSLALIQPARLRSLSSPLFQCPPVSLPALPPLFTQVPRSRVLRGSHVRGSRKYARSASLSLEPLDRD
jgi:hypothetical protein